MCTYVHVHVCSCTTLCTITSFRVILHMWTCVLYSSSLFGVQVCICEHIHVTCITCLEFFLFTPEDDILDDINDHFTSNTAHMTTDHLKTQIHYTCIVLLQTCNFTHLQSVTARTCTCTDMYYSYYPYIWDCPRS